MTVSIIIAVKTWQKNLEECVNKCLELDFSDFEILLLPDDFFKRELLPNSPIPIAIIPTGPVSPGRKRDLSIHHARAEILAFLDDDAYPARDWLKNAVKYFEDDTVAAVGGPAVTPPSDNFRQKASGQVYSTLLVSGKYNYRYLPKNKTEVDDYPSCNFLVRKSILQKLGGFRTDFWPGEDTALCLDITKKLCKRIIYAPDVLAYHHRRPVFKAHLKQIASYALHRGYFVKKYPQTSLRLAYFLPSIFVIGLLLGGVTSLFLPPIKIMYFLGLSLYLILVLISSISKELQLVPYIFCGIILTHLIYGIWFIKGLLSRRLAEEDKL